MQNKLSKEVMAIRKKWVTERTVKNKLRKEVK